MGDEGKRVIIEGKDMKSGNCEGVEVGGIGRKPGHNKGSRGGMEGGEEIEPKIAITLLTTLSETKASR